MRWLTFKELRKIVTPSNNSRGQQQTTLFSTRILNKSFDNLQQYRHIWIKKATGLGITEFKLRYMAWLCLRNNDLTGTQMCIVTGPRIDLTIILIDRMKKLSTHNGLASFDSKETVIDLNGVHLEGYPAHHLDAMRGLPDVSFILLDEADFFHQESSKTPEMFQKDTSQNQIPG